MKRIKSLRYAYPTSPNADQMKMKNGCWYVSVDGGVIAVFNTDEKLKALNYFEAEEGEVDSISSFTRESPPFKERA